MIRLLVKITKRDDGFLLGFLLSLTFLLISGSVSATGLDEFAAEVGNAKLTVNPAAAITMPAYLNLDTFINFEEGAVGEDILGGSASFILPGTWALGGGMDLRISRYKDDADQIETIIADTTQSLFLAIPLANNKSLGFRYTEKRTANSNYDQINESNFTEVGYLDPEFWSLFSVGMVYRSPVRATVSDFAEPGYWLVGFKLLPRFSLFQILVDGGNKIGNFDSPDAPPTEIDKVDTSSKNEVVLTGTTEKEITSPIGKIGKTSAFLMRIKYSPLALKLGRRQIEIQPFMVETNTAEIKYGTKDYGFYFSFSVRGIRVYKDNEKKLDFIFPTLSFEVPIGKRGGNSANGGGFKEDCYRKQGRTYFPKAKKWVWCNFKDSSLVH